jgi:hypothetical protein
MCVPYKTDCEAAVLSSSLHLLLGTRRPHFSCKVPYVQSADHEMIPTEGAGGGQEDEEEVGGAYLARQVVLLQQY